MTVVDAIGQELGATGLACQFFGVISHQKTFLLTSVANGYIASINEGNMTMRVLTAEQIKRVNIARREVLALIRKELAYSPDLRNAERINEYNGRLAGLEKMLVDAGAWFDRVLI